jgi:hypothetical protein
MCCYEPDKCEGTMGPAFATKNVVDRIVDAQLSLHRAMGAFRNKDNEEAERELIVVDLILVELVRSVKIATEMR